MPSRLAIEAVTPRATGITFVMLEMRSLSLRTCGVRPHLPLAFDAAHLPTSRHSDSKIDVDWLPDTTRPEFAVS